MRTSIVFNKNLLLKLCNFFYSSSWLLSFQTFPPGVLVMKLRGSKIFKIKKSMKRCKTSKSLKGGIEHQFLLIPQMTEHYNGMIEKSFWYFSMWMERMKNWCRSFGGLKVFLDGKQEGMKSIYYRQSLNLSLAFNMEAAKYSNNFKLSVGRYFVNVYLWGCNNYLHHHWNQKHIL